MPLFFFAFLDESQFYLVTALVIIVITFFFKKLKPTKTIINKTFNTNGKWFHVSTLNLNQT